MNVRLSDISKLKTPLTLAYVGTDLATANEVKFLQTKNSDNKLLFVDLTTSVEIADEYGVSIDTMKEKLIVRDADGQVLTGHDALYAAHAAVGLGSWFEMCRLPGLTSVGTGIRPKN